MHNDDENKRLFFPKYYERILYYSANKTRSFLSEKHIISVFRTANYFPKPLKSDFFRVSIFKLSLIQLDNKTLLFLCKIINTFL